MAWTTTRPLTSAVSPGAEISLAETDAVPGPTTRMSSPSMVTTESADEKNVK